jgi:hypothetical protein
MTMTALDSAARYLDLGLLPIPIPTREKAPKLDGWPALRLTKADLPRFFNGAPSNIGLILGDDYGTCDMDLDCAEAISAASELAPETGMVFGHASKPASHYFYRCDPPVRSKRYTDPVDKACIVEIRCQKSDGSAGLQTIAPPSIHPSGEEIRFESGRDGHPANVDAAKLQAAVARVAAASVFARHWPAEKSGRNEAFLCLAGALARGGWPVDEAVLFHAALYRALWGARANLDAAKAEVIATYEKHAGGFRTTGRRHLSDLVNGKVAATALTWLGISEPVMPIDGGAARTGGRLVAAPKSFDAESLMNDEAITVPELMVEGFLPRQGLVLLGGRPKEGKSWFACQLALSVITGQALGGWLQVREQGRVQLWALEDQFSLTKDKIGKLLRGARPDQLRDLRIFAELAQPILRGGDQIIRKALQEHPAELIILDSLFKLAGASQPQYDISQRDYDLIERVRQIALDARSCAVVIMHTKKNSPGGNPIENLLGTSGTPAAADVVGELKRFKGGGKLTIVGRSVPAEDYEIEWHGGPDEWGWTIGGQGDSVSGGETAQDVLAFLEAQGSAKPATIASALHKSFGAVWQALLRLQERGKVARGSDKRWQVIAR